MTNTVPTPPDAEQSRQLMVHQLRTSRVRWADRLVQSGFTDMKAASVLVEVNAKIEILQYLGNPIDAVVEPSPAEIRERGLNWYWEEWDDKSEDSDDEVD